MRKIRSKEVLSQEELAEIGSIAVQSTICEQLVGEMLWHLADMSESIGEHFTQAMSISTRLDLLRTLGAERLATGSPELAEFSGIVSDLKALNALRNHAIHGSWGAWAALRDLIKLSVGQRVIPKALKFGKPGKPPTELLASDLTGLPERIAEATSRLEDFADRHWPRPELIE